jgi:8-oxo-dGTP pyrophosphatase MutT (NUDIX family)
VSDGEPSKTHTDGDGWTHCQLGHRHWGIFGAAGLLVCSVDEEGRACVLLQHRSDFSHHGGTWGIPGGARGQREDAQTAAFREAVEEADLPVEHVRVRYVHVDDHGGWSYQTVIADAAAPLPTTPNAESVALVWQPVPDVDQLPLHPGFAHSWPTLRGLLPGGSEDPV